METFGASTAMDGFFSQFFTICRGDLTCPCPLPRGTLSRLVQELLHLSAGPGHPFDVLHKLLGNDDQHLGLVRRSRPQHRISVGSEYILGPIAVAAGDLERRQACKGGYSAILPGVTLGDVKGFPGTELLSSAMHLVYWPGWPRLERSRAPIVAPQTLN